MKKLYLAGIVFLVSLLAVSAGEFPDEDMDGWCETPFCGKLDNCPKIACEQLGLPIEGCADPELNKDSDGDGAGDGCDECPNDPAHLTLPCTPPRRSGGGSSGGGGSPGCRSKTQFNGQFHKNVGWSCITEADCEATARKQNLNENEYLCTITDSKQAGNIVVNTCECSKVGGYSAPPAYLGIPGGGAAVSQPSLAEQQRPVQVDYRRVEAPRQPATQFVAQMDAPGPADTSWVPVVVILALIVVGVVYYMRRQR